MLAVIFKHTNILTYLNNSLKVKTLRISSHFSNLTRKLRTETRLWVCTSRSQPCQLWVSEISSPVLTLRGSSAPLSWCLEWQHFHHSWEPLLIFSEVITILMPNSMMETRSLSFLEFSSTLTMKYQYAKNFKGRWRSFSIVNGTLIGI